MEDNDNRFGGGQSKPTLDSAPGDDLSVHRGGSPLPDEQRLGEMHIYRRSPSPVQGGRAHTAEWIVEFEPLRHPEIDPLMGWISSGDVQQQVRLSFDSLDAATGYCQRQGLPYTVTMPRERRPRLRSYADNYIPFEDGQPKPIYPH